MTREEERQMYRMVAMLGLIIQSKSSFSQPTDMTLLARRASQIANAMIIVSETEDRQ